MGTKRLKRQPGDRAAGTAPLSQEADKKASGPLKPGTGPLKKGTGRLKKGTGSLGKTTTAQLRMPPSRRRRRTSPLKRLFLTGMLAGGVGLACALGAAFAFFQSLNPGLQHEGALDTTLAFADGLMPLSARETVLMLGTDYSYAEGGHRLADGPVRSDSMIVVSADPATHEVQLVSVPRDTRVLVRGHYDKINAAMAYGGPELACQAVSELLGVPIHRWVTLNTAGLEQLVDTVGGVTIDVEKDMHYVDQTAHLNIDLHKGTQLLTGKEAHGYVRFRHDELGDIGRVQRQQKFLRAVAAQLLLPQGMIKAPQLLATVQKSLQTNLSPSEIMQLALFAPRLGSREHIRMAMLPGAFSSGMDASYWLVSPEAAREFGRRLLGDGGRTLPLAQAKSQLKLTVLNGASEQGVATAAARELRAAGWNVLAVGEAPNRDVVRTRVIAQTGFDQLGGTIGHALGVSSENVSASIGDLGTDFTVIVGEDFARTHVASLR